MKKLIVILPLFVAASLSADCKSCTVKRAKVYKKETATHYTGNLEDGTLIHVTRTEPQEATLNGRKIESKAVNGKLVQKESTLSTEEAQTYYEAIKAAA